MAQLITRRTQWVVLSAPSDHPTNGYAMWVHGSMLHTLHGVAYDAQGVACSIVDPLLDMPDGTTVPVMALNEAYKQLGLMIRADGALSHGFLFLGRLASCAVRRLLSAPACAALVSVLLRPGATLPCATRALSRRPGRRSAVWCPLGRCDLT